MSPTLALGIGALLLAMGGKKSVPTKTPAPSNGGAGDALDKVTGVVDAVVEAGAAIGGAVGAAGGIGGGAGGSGVIGGKAAGDAGGAGAAVKGGADATWGIPATIAGVSTGFLVVAGLWAVALVAGIVFSALLAPEMARRGTMGRLYSGTYGSFAWRAGRLYWAQLVANRYGLRVAQLRWPSLGTTWGDLNVKGYLPVVESDGERIPADMETDYPVDIYAVYSFARNRPPPNVAKAIASVDAERLAQMWTLGMVSAVKAAGRFIGDVADNTRPQVDPMYFTGDSDGNGNGLLIGLFTDAQVEWNIAAGRVPLLEEQRAAWLQGVQDGLAFVRANAWGVGGRYLLEDKRNAAQSIASTLVAWQPDFVAGVNQQGRQARFAHSVEGSGDSFRVWLEIANDAGDATFIEVKL